MPSDARPSRAMPSRAMPSREFRSALAHLTGELEGRPLDADLQAWLNREHGVASDTYRQFESHCHLGIVEGWMCEREAGGIRYGRVFKPAGDLNGFSVDTPVIYLLNMQPCQSYISLT